MIENIKKDSPFILLGFLGIAIACFIVDYFALLGFIIFGISYIIVIVKGIKEKRNIIIHIILTTAIWAILFYLSFVIMALFTEQIF